MTNIDLVRLLLQHLGKPESLINSVKDRPGHDRRYAIDATKIKRDLDWHPMHNFEKGIVETITWYQKNQQWWERVVNAEYREYYEKMYGGR